MRKLASGFSGILRVAVLSLVGAGLGLAGLHGARAPAAGPAVVYTWRSDATDIHTAYQDVQGPAGGTSAICSRVLHFTGPGTVYKMALAYPTWDTNAQWTDTAFASPLKYAAGIEYPATRAWSGINPANFTRFTFGGAQSVTVAGGGSAGFSPLTGQPVSGQVITDAVTLATPIPPRTEFMEQNCIVNPTGNAAIYLPLSGTLGGVEGYNYATISYYNTDPIARNLFLGGSSFTPLLTPKSQGFFADAILVYENASDPVVLLNSDSKGFDFDDGSPAVTNVGATDFFGYGGEEQRYFELQHVGYTNTSRGGDSYASQAVAANVRYRLPLWTLDNPSVVEIGLGTNDSKATQTSFYINQAAVMAEMKLALPGRKFVALTIEPATMLPIPSDYWGSTTNQTPEAPYTTGVLYNYNHMLLTNPAGLGFSGVIDMMDSVSTAPNSGIIKAPNPFKTVLTTAVTTSSFKLPMAAAPLGCPSYPPFEQVNSYTLLVDGGTANAERMEVNYQRGMADPSVTRGYDQSTIHAHVAGATVVETNMWTFDGVHLNWCGSEGAAAGVTADVFNVQ